MNLKTTITFGTMAIAAVALETNKHQRTYTTTSVTVHGYMGGMSDVSNMRRNKHDLGYNSVYVLEIDHPSRDVYHPMLGLG